ncbi:hypothetical protein BDV38DRAFT_268689 [Aspergillus pseudotamarii]|uniref:Protein kinase domain-containing protein n=1 Tax=Aspergillus pseudotamarii TaxID=132259 RepID=A0A5N6T3R3_ASPPS|nr:uncharacterized protein BDV38DRAFT_268689 [Aspergillus pseudotamarii]KAE8140932.1 hypothetical protein BDV38DRAFT_268689 [Aspergillus pseudotamarii]
MSQHPGDLLVFDPSSLRIEKELKTSEAFSIFEVELLGHRYALKVQGPYYHGYIDRLDPARFQPHLNHFMNDSHGPTAILLEYLQDTEEPNCVNYSDDRLRAAIIGLRGIHGALIHHRDVYPKNILIICGPPESVVWINFAVAVTFDSGESMGHQGEEYCSFDIELVKSFGELLEDQRLGLPPNTKYY